LFRTLPCFFFPPASNPPGAPFFRGGVAFFLCWMLMASAPPNRTCSGPTTPHFASFSYRSTSSFFFFPLSCDVFLWFPPQADGDRRPPPPNTSNCFFSPGFDPPFRDASLTPDSSMFNDSGAGLILSFRGSLFTPTPAAQFALTVIFLWSMRISF